MEHARKYFKISKNINRIQKQSLKKSTEESSKEEKLNSNCINWLSNLENKTTKKL
jgi:hypothetical protein